MQRIYSVAWSPDGRWLAAGGDSRHIQIWDLVQETVICTLTANTALVRSISWSADSKLLACGQGDWKEYAAGHIQVWDVATADMAWSTREPFYGAYAICFSPNGQWLASGHGSGLTNIWEAATGKKYITTFVCNDVRNLINGIGFSADSRLVACGTCYEDGLYIYNLDGIILHEVVFPKQPTWFDAEHPVRFSPNGRWVARGSQAGQVSLWRTDEPLLSTDFVGLETAAYAIDWSPDGRFLAGGSRYGRMIIWDVDLGESVRMMMQRPLHCLRYSPGGCFLAGAGDDPAVHIWDVDPESVTFGQCLKILNPQ